MLNFILKTPKQNSHPKTSKKGDQYSDSRSTGKKKSMHKNRASTTSTSENKEFTNQINIQLEETHTISKYPPNLPNKTLELVQTR